MEECSMLSKGGTMKLNINALENKKIHITQPYHPDVLVPVSWYQLLLMILFKLILVPCFFLAIF